MHNNIYNVRKSCRLCLESNLKLVVNLPLTTPGEHLKESISDKVPDPIPIDLYQCNKCGHVQVTSVPDPNILFGCDYTFMPSDNPLLIDHFNSSVKYFVKNYKNDLKFAFEIGSNDGVFLKQLKNITNCKVLGVDPSSKPVKIARNNNIDTILDYFTPKIADKVIKEHGNPELIIANNIFAHIDDLRGILKAISKMLKDGNFFMFEASYLKDVVEKYLIGTIIHEHLSIHSIYSLIPFFKEFQLEIVGIRHVNNVQGGAIVGIAQKNSTINKSKHIEQMIQAEHEAGITNINGMIKFNNRLKDKLKHFKKEINQILYNKKVVGYGAARSATLIIDLLELGNKLNYIIDDNPMKKNKFMPIANIPIIGSEKHNHSSNIVFIILGWAQTERIINTIKKLYNNCKIITVYPNFEVINID